MKSHHNTRKGMAVAISCAAGALFTTSLAQAQMQIEEIVVTAQKRAENIQDVPISVSAVSSTRAEELGLYNSEGLTHAVPGLTVSHNGTAPAFYLRGIGSAASQSGQESAIATFVDGVYQPGFNASLFSLNSIERIEVLKGPQGTLFGRNATGGALNVVTRDPSFETAVTAELGYGNHETKEGNFYATGGLTDKIAGDLALYHSEMGEGFGENLTTGGDSKLRKDRAYRGKLLIDVTEDTRVVLSAGTSKNWGNSGMSYRPGPTAIPLLNSSPGLPAGADFWDIISDNDPNQYIETTNTYARVVHDFDGATLTSITAYNEIDIFQDGDLDTSPVNLVDYDSIDKNKQFTQELQLSSAADSEIKWILGLFYMDAEAKYDPLHIFGPVLGLQAPGLLGTNAFAAQDTTSTAAFGQVTYPVSEKIDFTLGLRYTRDERDFDGVTLLDFGAFEVPAAPAVKDSIEQKEPTWRLALDYKFTDDVMAFVSYNRGFKSGSYNTTAPYDPPVEPETLDAYEIGLKSTLFDNRLRLNMAAFFYDYTDIQLAKITGAAQTILNAAEAEVYGFDMDIDAVVTENFSINGGLSLLDAEYTKFDGAPIINPNPNFPFGTVEVNCALNPSVCDVSGNSMIRTPDMTYNLGMLYTMPVAAGELALAASYSYNDGFFFEVDNRLEQDSYGIFNAQLKWTSPGDQYYVRLYGRNLTDEEYYAQSQGIFTADLVTAADGRTYGLAVGVQF